MVDDSGALDRLHFDGFDIPIFLQAAIGKEVSPLIGTRARNLQVFGQHLYDQIRLADFPFAVIEHERRRHVGWIPPRRASIDPFHDGGDLLIRESAVVLELSYSHVWIDIPGRHDPQQHLLFDGFCPRPGLFVRQQRHGCDVIRPVTALAGALQDRRYILREGHFLRCCCRRLCAQAAGA